MDNDRNSAARLDGYWDQRYNIGRCVVLVRHPLLLKSFNRSTVIKDNLRPGDHLLSCELLKHTEDPNGGHEFRIISVMRCVVHTALGLR